MNKSSITIIATAALAAACGQEERLLLPETVAIHWNASFNGLQDDRVAIVPVDVLVYDAADGVPLSGVDVDISVTGAHTVLAEVDDVAPAFTGCVECDVVWDAYQDEYYLMKLTDRDDASRLQLTADSDGIAKFYVVVDAFELDSDTFLAVDVVAETGLAQGTFSLLPR